MRKLLCRACCLALCFSFALDVKADLTQQQVTEAVYNALTISPLNFSGGQINTVPWMFPSLTAPLLGEYLVIASGWEASPSQPPTDTLRSLLGDISANTRTNSVDFSSLFPLLATVTNDMVTANQLSAEFNSISRYYLDSLHRLDSYTYTESNELLVHDASLNSLVSNMVFDSAGVGADLSSLLSYSIGMENDLAYIRSRFEAEEALDETATSVVSRAETAQEDEYETKLQEALDEYDSIPLPEEEDQYVTQAVDPEGPSPDDVFGNLNTSVTHSALLQLVPRGEEILPEIEVDFGRDSSFTSFCLRLNDLTDWLYPILGTFVLSLKGLAMWRTVRQASIAASASGESPIVPLAWSPF